MTPNFKKCTNSKITKSQNHKNHKNHKYRKYKKNHKNHKNHRKITETSFSFMLSSSDSTLLPIPTYQLRITTLTGKVILIEYVSSQSIEELKHSIENVEGIPVHLQRLIYMGKEMVDGTKLSEYHVQPNGVVHLVLRKNEVVAEIGQGDGERQNVQENGGGGEQNVVGDEELARRLQQGEFGVSFGFAQQLNVLQGGEADRIAVISRFSRTVRMFALFDAVFLAIWALSSPFLFLGLFLVLSGFYGATYYLRNYVVAYGIYLILIVGVRIYAMTVSISTLYTILLVISCLIEMYIFRIVYQFIKLIEDISDQERIGLYAVR